MVSLIWGIFKKKLIYKTEVESWIQETNLWLPGWGGINWKIGTDVYILLYIKYITNNNLLYIQQGTLSTLMAYVGKES